jgi:hypothetical protein
MKSKELEFSVSSLSVVMVMIGIFAIIVMSCDNKKQSSSDAIQNDSLLLKYTALRDSVDKEWEIMITDDDVKHNLMRRLLLEVSYTNNYDKEQFQELNEQTDQLHAMRYDQKSMRNSASIDMYDSVTFNLTDQLITYARKHPRFEDFPLMAELIDDINQKNNYILMHRIHYDDRVKELNSFKKTYSNNLLESDIGDLPLFELPS